MKPEKTPIHDTKIYALLLEGLPIRFTDRFGRLDTAQLAQECELTRWTIYRWLNGESMSSRNAKKLIEISENTTCERKGKINKETLTPFILGF